MKVNIGKYPSRWVCNWHTDYMSNKYGHDWPPSTTRFENALEKLEDAVQWLYNHTINLYIDKKKRKVSVKLVPSDTWSMDETLSHIIVPMLKQLKESKHGAPYVDLKDVPESLHPTESSKGVGDVDSTHFERWDYILDEMIWAFTQYTIDWESQYWEFEEDLESVFGVKTREWDREGMEEHHQRMKNGVRLFGKYYENLWD